MNEILEGLIAAARLVATLDRDLTEIAARSLQVSVTACGDRLSARDAARRVAGGQPVSLAAPRDRRDERADEACRRWSWAWSSICS